MPEISVLALKKSDTAQGVAEILVWGKRNTSSSGGTSPHTVLLNSTDIYSITDY